MKDYNVYIIDAEHSGMMLKNYLRKALRLSKRTLISLKNNNALKINGEEGRTKDVLKEGDRLEIILFEEQSENIFPEPMELDIAYEDEYLIVINKPANMPVHPTRRHIMGTLANGLVYYWMDRERSKVVRPVNRLDKNTSGLIVFAKNSHIQHLLSQFMGKAEFEKEYLAVVEGVLSDRTGTVDAPIARECEHSIKRVVREDGDVAVTHFTVLEQFQEASLVSIKLETGRTHQIRVHMSYIGHPLLGDELYGGNIDMISRHALHANRITMLHPALNNWIELEALLPEDMKQLIDILSK